MRAVIGAMAHDPELAEAFRAEVIGWRKKEMAALLSRGIARGDVRPDVPVEIARELGQSVLWHRLLITGDPITDDLVVQLVDDVLVPFVAPRSHNAVPTPGFCAEIDVLLRCTRISRRMSVRRNPATTGCSWPSSTIGRCPSDDSSCGWSTCCPSRACGLSASSPRRSS